MWGGVGRARSFFVFGPRQRSGHGLDVLRAGVVHEFLNGIDQLVAEAAHAVQPVLGGDKLAPEVAQVVGSVGLVGLDGAGQQLRA